MSISDTETLVRTKVKKPSFYKVIFLNDDFTPMEFVVHILMTLFNKSFPEAHAITMAIHTEKRGVVGVYPREIAELKVHETTTISQASGHPLKAISEIE